MTTEQIEEVILTSMCDRGFKVFLTRANVIGGNEADVFGINNNDYMYEYEIKQSRSDFRADFKKTGKHRDLSNRKAFRTYNVYKKGMPTKETEDHLLIPNRFFYVCAEDLIKLEEVPEYAGLIYVRGNGMMEIKSAPLLHKLKANKRLYKKIATALSFRMKFGCSYLTYKNNLKREPRV